MAMLAVSAGLHATLHHVDHHLRAESGLDAQLVCELGADLGFAVVVHDVSVASGGNLEARARAARRSALPRGAFTAHTMDDLAETVILNMMRGAGVDGLSPLVGEPTKPLLDVRRAELLELVLDGSRPFVRDPTNDDRSLRRNRVRHETLPAMCAAAERDLVPIIARQAALLADEKTWLDTLVCDPAELGDIDCHELLTWPVAQLRRWLRPRLSFVEDGDTHPPSADDVERVIEVVRGHAVATQVHGGRRLSRSGQRLTLENL
jgi:tRNA(Ile)-lysidine synthase